MRATASLAFLLVLLAGCTGGAPAGPQGPGGLDEPPFPDAATIRGLVVDDSQAPLAGADVAIAETGFTTQTGLDGAFEFANLPPGAYIVQVQMLGYESVVKKVEAPPNDEVQLTLVLSPIAIVEPYHDTFGPFNGYFECQLSVAIRITPCTGDGVHGQNLNRVVFPGDARRMSFNLTSDAWQTMVGESRWSKTSVATSQGMAIYPSYEKRAGTHWWCEADGASPVRFVYERSGDSVCTSQGVTTPEPSLEINPLVLVADPGFGATSVNDPPFRLMLQQRFELIMTVFYHEPAPADYSGFGDS